MTVAVAVTVAVTVAVAVAVAVAVTVAVTVAVAGEYPGVIRNPICQHAVILAIGIITDRIVRCERATATKNSSCEEVICKKRSCHIIKHQAAVQARTTHVQQ